MKAMVYWLGWIGVAGSLCVLVIAAYRTWRLNRPATPPPQPRVSKRELDGPPTEAIAVPPQYRPPSSAQLIAIARAYADDEREKH